MLLLYRFRAGLGVGRVNYKIALGRNGGAPKKESLDSFRFHFVIILPSFLHGFIFILFVLSHISNQCHKGFHQDPQGQRNVNGTK